MNKNDLLGKKLIPLYNHPNKLATHHVDRHRNWLGAYNFDVQFVKGTKVPYDYASHHPKKEEFKYTREEKEELAIEQEEEDAEIWIIAVLEELIKAFIQEELQKGTKEDLELVKILKEKQSSVKSKETSKGPYGKIWDELRI